MSNSKRRTQLERKEISDAKMFDAAVELIVTRGAANTTLKDVGESAGFSRGLAGYRFGDKDGLFDFVLRRASKVWRDELALKTENKYGYEAIAAAVDAHVEHCETAPKQVEAFYRLWFESLSPDSKLRPTILSIHERRLSDVEAWIEKGIEMGSLQSGLLSRQIASHFCTAVVGILYQWLNAPDDINMLRGLHDELKRTTSIMLTH